MPGIDLRINAADLADTFEHMRMWLDHEDCVPVNFDQIRDQTGTIIDRVPRRGVGAGILSSVGCLFRLSQRAD